MKATHFNQLKWLCVLQLIHDGNSISGERLSCWDEKNGLKFAFAVLLSLKYWKKNQTCFKLQALSVTSSRLFPKTKDSPFRHFRGMGSVIILFPLCVYLKNLVYYRNKWLFKMCGCFLYCTCQLLQRRMYVGHTVSFVTHSGGCLHLTSLAGCTTLGVQEKNWALRQRKLAGGNQMWLQVQQAQGRGYECQVPKRVATQILLEEVWKWWRKMQWLGSWGLWGTAAKWLTTCDKNLLAHVSLPP